MAKNPYQPKTTCNVYYNGTNSGTFDIICWVPQDSVSDPFLFLIDINDIGSASPIKFTPFADDTNIFKKDTVFNRITIEKLSKLSLWFKAKRLSLNITKPRENDLFSLCKTM